ncbi:MAG TPA: helix-turn-helix transcriptional regulator [Gemmatimonadaceae bacterium]|nr:helix-turn-helix transcriptional regulator [Gemmatimonadaceae bacterium]
MSLPTIAAPSFGALMREWRQRRRLSQLALALECGISQRHLSFVESGRAVPSREMVLRLAEQLEIPLRERNHLFLAAGYAPVYHARALDDPALRAARAAIVRVLEAHEPFPALAVDRQWNLVDANRPMRALISSVDPRLLTPPVNVLRVSLAPTGLATMIANLSQWRAHILDRLQRQLDASADRALADLLDELRGYPASPTADPIIGRDDGADVIVPLVLRTDAGVLSFLGTTTVFGTATEVTLSEITLESFFPADPETGSRLRAMFG